RCEAFLDAAELGRVFLLGVLTNAELTRIGIVAGIDAHLVGIVGRLHGGGGGEMDVGYQRNHDSRGSELSLGFAERASILHRGRGDTHDLAAGLDQSNGLRHRGPDVLGQGGRHGLHPDRVVAPHTDSADHDLARLSAAGVGLKLDAKARELHCLNLTNRRVGQAYQVTATDPSSMLFIPSAKAKRESPTYMPAMSR